MRLVLYIGLVVMLIVLGLFLHKDFFEYSLSFLETDRSVLFNHVVSDKSRIFLFPIILGMLPLFYLLVQRITKITFIYKGLIVSIIIIGFGILFWGLRIFGLNSEFEQISEYNLPGELQPTIDMDYLKFEIYLLMGFIVGTLVSILVFRDRTKSLLN